MSLTRFVPLKIPTRIYRKRKRDLNPIVDCQCGCGNFKMLYDRRGRSSNYLEGHRVGELARYRKPTPESNLKRSLTQSGIPKTEEWKAKIRGPNMKKSHPSKWKGLKNRFNPLQIEKIRQARLRQIVPRKDTKIEKMMQIALSLEQIKFETHKAIIGQPDIFIEPNICIFIDGCYWHGCRECFPDLIVNRRIFQTIFRDQSVIYKLNQLGYNVIRIREHTIKQSKAIDFSNIISLIKNTMELKV